MNNPLRYAGETYYQGGFEPGDTVSILQVVKNPARLTPYLACTLVGVGLLIQFLMHLVGFGKRAARSGTGKGQSASSQAGQRAPKRKAKAEASAVAAMMNTPQVADSLQPLKRRNS
jgi:hypothetical protein